MIVVLTFPPRNLTLNILSLTVLYPIIASALFLSHINATPFLLLSSCPDITILKPLQLKCPCLFHRVSHKPIIAIPIRFISPCMTSNFPLCILLTFHVPTFIDILQLMSSLCFLVRSAAGRPFGFGPVVSLDPVAPNSSLCSSSVAGKSLSGLRVSPSVAIVDLLLLCIMIIFLAVSRRWFAIAFPPFCLPCPFVHPLADTIIVLIDCQKGYQQVAPREGGHGGLWFVSPGRFRVYAPRRVVGQVSSLLLTNKP